MFKEKFDKLIKDLEEKIRTHYPNFDFNTIDKNSDKNALIIEFQHTGRTFLALFLSKDEDCCISEVIIQPISIYDFTRLIYENGLNGIHIMGNQLGVFLCNNNFEQEIEKFEFIPEKKILCKNTDNAVEIIYKNIDEQLNKLGYCPA